MKGLKCAVKPFIFQLWIVMESFIVSKWPFCAAVPIYYMNLTIKCWITHPTFALQARSTRESEIIGREGPVGIGQPGVVRAPSGLIMGLPATATPASKGKAPWKLPFFPNIVWICLHQCLSWPTCSCRPAGRVMGGADRRQQVGDWGVDRRASVRRPTERPPTQVQRRRLHPAQDAGEGQLREGTGEAHNNNTMHMIIRFPAAFVDTVEERSEINGSIIVVHSSATSGKHLFHWFPFIKIIF